VSVDRSGVLVVLGIRTVVFLMIGVIVKSVVVVDIEKTLLVPDFAKYDPDEEDYVLTNAAPRRAAMKLRDTIFSNE
jgi:hypothetical protein